MSQYQKGKTNLDFTRARDSEWQWHQLGHMQVCTSLHSDNHASTPPLSFLQAGCPSCRPTNSIKALKARNEDKDGNKFQLWLFITYINNIPSNNKSALGYWRDTYHWLHQLKSSDCNQLSHTHLPETCDKPLCNMNKSSVTAARMDGIAKQSGFRLCLKQ